MSEKRNVAYADCINCAAGDTRDLTARGIDAGVTFIPPPGNPKNWLGNGNVGPFCDMCWRVIHAPPTSRLSRYQQKSGHRREVHPPDNGCSVTCIVCNLFLCSICGALEGALLPTCPGRRLTEAEHDANYADYCHGTGPFATEEASWRE